MERIGIIDIGSNSIRLVIYEITDKGAYRVIDEAKESARLGGRVEPGGQIGDADIAYISETLHRFKLLCTVHGAERIRAVATAAVRNASNAGSVVSQLKERTGLSVEVLSGTDEGRLGFLGMANTLDVNDGFLIDIGGGSTEVTWFKDRQIQKTVSFPFGAVNTMQRFGKNGELSPEGARELRALVQQAVAGEPWLTSQPGLPLIGLGGTVRALCKIDQRSRRYSLPIMHNYRMTPEDTANWVTLLQSMKMEQRKKIEGLPKDRADIIVPGLHILHSIFELTGASHYIISGAGLRDGIFFETLRPEEPLFSIVLEHSVLNTLALHPTVSVNHVRQVERLSGKLFADLRQYHGLSKRAGLYLKVASLLYRIGISIHYYNFYKHTYYLLAHSRIDGLTHREIMLCALIASFKSEKRLKPLFAAHRDLLSEFDFELISKLGILMQLAVALDRSETQPISDLRAQVIGKELKLSVRCRHQWVIERTELDAVGKDFGKQWGLKIKVEEA